METSLETAIAIGLVWIAFKGLVTVLVLLGAGPILRRTPLAPLVTRLETHPALVRLRSRLRWSRGAAASPSVSTPAPQGGVPSAQAQ